METEARGRLWDPPEITRLGSSRGGIPSRKATSRRSSRSPPPRSAARGKLSKEHAHCAGASRDSGAAKGPLSRPALKAQMRSPVGHCPEEESKKQSFSWSREKSVGWALPQGPSQGTRPRPPHAPPWAHLHASCGVPPGKVASAVTDNQGKVCR